jgi:hypothetical protein
VITFDFFRDRTSRQDIGFGEEFFSERGIDAVHFIATDNHWFQTPELDHAISAVRPIAATYGEVFSYGSSMGGFAALRYGAHLGAETAIAFSPQFNIDSTKPPFEKRWRQFRGQSFHSYLPDGASRFPKRAVIFYDPRDYDAGHVALYEAETEVTRVHVPFVGHPATGMLSDSRLLPDTVAQILDGSFDHQDFRKRLREYRRSSDNYLFGLASRVRKPDIKEALAKRGLDVARDKERGQKRFFELMAEVQKAREKRSRNQRFWAALRRYWKAALAN